MKIVRIVAYALSVLVVLVAGLVVWAFYLPMPKTSGEIHLAGLKAPVQVERDAIGIPHIHAQSLDDLYLAQGYVTAQDRLWQMELLRRVGNGDVAEIAGARAMPLDTDSRLLGMRVAAEAAVTTLPADQKRYISAYTRGVNEFISTHGATLPVEFRMLRMSPRPWTEADSLVIGLHMFRTLTTTWKDELLKTALMQRVGVGRTAELMQVTTKRDHPPALQMEGGQPVARTFMSAFPSADVNVRATDWPMDEHPAGFPGSNNWVVAPSHSVSGKAMLANDPHLDLTMPSIWYVVQLSAPGMDVAGVSLPGLPAVVIGHNEKIAWGLTNFGADVQDLYLEAVDPSNPHRYLVDGEWRDAQVRKETIHVHNERDRELEVVVTRHGPLMVNKPGERYALRWVATEPGVWRFPFPKINAAGNWDEFTTALREFPGPTQNFVYADAAGNIGYYGAGLIPIRPTGDGSFPLRGDQTANDWKGYIPFEQLPHVYNPPSGIIATANARVVPDNYPYPVATRWETPDRTERIYHLLQEKPKLTSDDLRRIQIDVYSEHHHRMAQAFAAAVEAEMPHGVDARLRAAAAALHRWDGVAREDAFEPVLADFANAELREKLLRPVMGDILPQYDWKMQSVFFERIVTEHPAAWLPRGFADYDQFLTDCLATALVASEKRFATPDITKWRWGAVMAQTFSNPIGGGIRGLHRIFNIGPFEQPGTGFSVKQTTHSLGPSMHFVVDFADLEKTTLTITTGESGQPLSGHYKDQFAKWKSGEGVPLSFAVSADGRAKLVLNP